MRPIWTFAIVSVALFMVVLDNLVVTNALPSIREDLGATIQSLEWTVNAYTLSYAVLLLTGAALGDRFGRRRMFVSASLFTAASAAAALARPPGALIAARAQGVGAAIVTPLTLTLLADVPGRAARLGDRRLVGISGLGVALGPLVGGAVVDGISWHWIFWLNVPIGLALPLARAADREPRAGALARPARRRPRQRRPARHRLRDRARRRAGLDEHHGAVLADRRRGADGGLPGLGARAPEPMLPLRFFRSRAFSSVSVVSLAMYFGVFGSIFLLAQFFQVAQGYSRSRPACGRCRGPRCRCSSPRSPACCPTGSAPAR